MHKRSNFKPTYVNVTRTKHDLVLSDLRLCTDYEVQEHAYTTAGPSEFGSLSIPIDTSGENCFGQDVKLFFVFLLFQNTCSSAKYTSSMLAPRFKLPTGWGKTFLVKGKTDISIQVLKWCLINEQECCNKFKTRSGAEFLDLIKHELRVYWTASKTFLDKRVPTEFITSMLLWTLEISTRKNYCVED